MHRKLPQILLRRFRKWKTGSSLMEWMMHQAHCGHQGEGEEIEKRRGLEFERRRALKLKAMRVEVGDEG
jgi:hypothetical protein